MHANITTIVLFAFMISIAKTKEVENVKQCCYPYTMEGYAYIKAAEKSVYMGFDFHIRRFMVSPDMTSDTFQIIDLNTTVVYNFDSSGCRATQKVDLAVAHERCFDQSLLSTQLYAMAESEDGDTVHIYTYTETTGTIVLQIQEAKGPYCFPSYMFRVRNGANNTVKFFDFVDKDPNAKLYTPLDACPNNLY